MTFLEQVEFLLRGAGISILILAAIQLCIRYRHTLAGQLGVAFCITSVCYVLCRPLGVTWDIGWWGLPVYLGCFSSAAVFWMMSRAWFDDHFRIRRWHFAAMAVLSAMFLRQYLWPEFVTDVFGITAPEVVREFRDVVPRLISVGFVLAALIQAQFGREDDLIEARRRFRDRLVIIVGAYMVGVAGVELYLLGKPPSLVFEVVNLFCINVMLLVIMTYGMRMRDGLFAEPRVPVDTTGAQIIPGATPDAPQADMGAKPPDPQEEALLADLRHFIEADAGYREPGLTIAALAETLKVPEYRLRRAINGRLGHRNFSDFLNGHRVADACRQLRDPDKARLPVLTIALDVGFNSLGPFNRAFKAITGTTPMAWRQGRNGDA